MKMFSFEKLKVWQKSRQLSVFIYKVTKLFPDDERFGLISQMRRCVVSISSNIAEGMGRHSLKTGLDLLKLLLVLQRNY